MQNAISFGLKLMFKRNKFTISIIIYTDICILLDLQTAIVCN